MKKPNLRPAPAFQEYAADLIAKREFRLMTLGERGLLMSMRLECWVNKKLPCKPFEMAKIFGYSLQEVSNLLTPNVLCFFRQDCDNLYCIELDAYRENQAAKQAAQSKGGSNGGKTTQKKHRESKAKLEGKVKLLSREDKSGEELRRGELNKSEVSEEHKDWLSEYDDEPKKGYSYREQSRGY